uniref:Large ribosomal subunit protein mL50 n=1 Tax=Taeniopygia guttata TaxID=59729 RepID=A0A674G6U7_TAEGU
VYLPSCRLGLKAHKDQTSKGGGLDGIDYISQEALRGAAAIRHRRWPRRAPGAPPAWWRCGRCGWRRGGGRSSAPRGSRRSGAATPGKEEGEVEADRAVPEKAESSEPSLIHPLPRCRSYIPPEDLQSCLECHVREVFGPSVPEDWQQAPLQENRLKYRLLARLAAELGHAVPNSQLHRVRCAGDVLGFYRTPIKDSTEIDELAAAELPLNLKIIRSGDSPHAAFPCLAGAVGQQQSPLVGVKSVNFSNKGSLSFAHVWLFLFCSFFPADQFLRGTGAAWALPAAPCPFPAAGNRQDPVGINKGTISSFYFAPLC